MDDILKVKYKETIFKFITNYLKTKDSEFGNISPLGKEAFSKFLEFSLSGKLVRGSLVLFIYEQIKKEITEDAVAVASALELIHSSFLIHDDIMDQDTKRRGKETVYAQYIQEGSNNKFSDANQYGVSAGISVGDLGYFLGFELLSQFAQKEIVTFCAKEFSKVTLAQLQDVYNGHTSKEISEETIIDVYIYKTGRYTFSVPFIVGSMLAKKDNDIKNLEAIGENLGVLFQLKDDELGVLGDEKITGKSIGGDIKENKKTILRKTLFEKVNKEELKKIKNIFGNKNVSENEVKFILKLIKKYNVIKDQEVLWGKYETAVIQKSNNFDTVLKSAIFSLMSYNKSRVK